MNNESRYFCIESNLAVPHGSIHPLDDLEVSSKRIEPSRLPPAVFLSDRGGLKLGLFDCVIKVYEKGHIQRGDILYMNDLIFRLSWDKRTEIYRCIDWNLVNLANALDSAGVDLVTTRWCDTHEEFIFRRR